MEEKDYKKRKLVNMLLKLKGIKKQKLKEEIFNLDEDDNDLETTVQYLEDLFEKIEEHEMMDEDQDEQSILKDITIEGFLIHLKDDYLNNRISYESVENIKNFLVHQDSEMTLDVINRNHNFLLSADKANNFYSTIIAFLMGKIYSHIRKTYATKKYKDVCNIIKISLSQLYKLSNLHNFISKFPILLANTKGRYFLIKNMKKIEQALENNKDLEKFYKQPFKLIINGKEYFIR